MTQPTIRVVAAVIEREGRYLITQRREEAVLPLYWEFPGGKVEPGESDEAALRRELAERLDVALVVGDKIGERHHVYAGYEVHLALYQATLSPDPNRERPPRAHRVRDLRWVTSAEFADHPFPAADQATMDLLLGLRPPG